MPKPCEAVDEWNKTHAVGTYVIYESIKDDPTTRRAARTRSVAFLADSGTAVIFLEGQSGYVALDHVKAERMAGHLRCLGDAMNIIVYSEELSREDIQALLQAIRDCEQKNFPDKAIGIFAVIPFLNSAECTEVLKSIKPPFIGGEPMIFGGKDGD
jgi:hypothetical protein